MRRRNAMPRRFPFVFIAFGTYIVLISLGLLPTGTSPRGRAIFDGLRHWQITCFGLAIERDPARAAEFRRMLDEMR